jgi:hypothetical protein
MPMTIKDVFPHHQNLDAPVISLQQVLSLSYDLEGPEGTLLFTGPH